MASREIHKTDVGRRLAFARGLGGCTARQLCHLSRLSSGVVAMIERGYIKNPSLRTLRSLSDVLGVSLDWLDRGTGPEPTESDVLAAIARARGEQPSEEAAA